MHKSFHRDISIEIHKEILADTNNPLGWYSPVASHKIFDQAYMKFINRNLNYFDFGNMVACTIEDPEYNKSFPTILNFCNSIRELVGQPGPFGRMCVWKVPPGMKIQPHKDNFRYHNCITRYIFCVSPQTTEIKIDIAKHDIQPEQGLLFSFFPAIEQHSFENTSNEDWFFLGFDYWKMHLLEASRRNLNLSAIMANPTRYATFGYNNEKFMSEH